MIITTHSPEHDDLIKSVVRLNNIVCGEGKTYMPMINSEREFMDLYSYYFSSWRFPTEYADEIIIELEEMSLVSRKNTLKHYKEVIMYLLKGSSLSSRYCSANITETGKRLVNLSKQGVFITLSKCDYVPEHFDSINNLDEGLIYLVYWKIYLYECYRDIIKLQKVCRYKGLIKRRWEGYYRYREEDTLDWYLSRRKLNELIKKLKRFFARGTDLKYVSEVLNSDTYGNVMWVGSTEALVHLFTMLKKCEFILCRDWRTVISDRLMFCSKQGNFITSKNLNATAYRLKNKEVTTPELAHITKILNSLN